MKIHVMRFFILVLMVFSTAIYACGNNPNAVVQGPFKDNYFTNGMICFQNTFEKRDIEFYLSFDDETGGVNLKVDTFYYSDAPAELMSVFFMSINGARNVVVLLRWHVNYAFDGIEYPYYYGIVTYEAVKGKGYIKNLDRDNTPELSGYQTKHDGEVTDFPLDNAAKIKKFLHDRYGK